MEPDLEALGVAQPRKLTPGEEECLLDGVLSPLAIAQNSIRDGVSAVAVQVDEVGESDIVAIPCALDQPRSQDRTSRLRHGRALRQLEMVAQGERFSFEPRVPRPAP
jgi:hypothetical protein